MRSPCLFVAVIALAACATPSDRISSALIDQGVDRDYAVCIGERLADRLSNDQLRQLGDAADAYSGGTTPDRLTVDDLLDVAKAIDDPMVVVAVTRAGIGCGITGWRDEES